MSAYTTFPSSCFEFEDKRQSLIRIVLGSTSSLAVEHVEDTWWAEEHQCGNFLQVGTDELLRDAQSGLLPYLLQGGSHLVSALLPFKVSLESSSPPLPSAETNDSDKSGVSRRLISSLRASRKLGSWNQG